MTLLSIYDTNSQSNSQSMTLYDTIVIDAKPKNMFFNSSLAWSRCCQRASVLILVSTLLASLVLLKDQQRTLAVHLHTRDIFEETEVERVRTEFYMPELVSKITDTDHQVDEMSEDKLNEEKSMKKTLASNDDGPINNVMHFTDVPIKQTHTDIKEYHNETNDLMNNVGYAADVPIKQQQNHIDVLAKAYHNVLPLNAVTPSTSRLVKRFPRYMIIGFGKAGTKALYEALKLHPSLSGPLTERRYFSRYYSKGLWSYLTHLPDPPPGGFTIEKSPDYITSPETPKRIVQTAKMIGINSSSLKFIVVLRNPIDRAMSEYLEWNIQHRLHHQPLLPSFSKMVVTTTGEVNSSVLFLNSSCYAQHILNWLQVFRQEQMCFVDGDQFISNPYEEVHILEQCMGIRQFFTQDNFVYQPQRGFYCFQVRGENLCMSKAKGRKHPTIPQGVLAKLKAFFHPWNKQLLDLTGREFTDWDE